MSVSNISKFEFFRIIFLTRKFRFFFTFKSSKSNLFKQNHHFSYRFYFIPNCLTVTVIINKFIYLIPDEVFYNVEFEKEEIPLFFAIKSINLTYYFESYYLHENPKTGIKNIFIISNLVGIDTSLTGNRTSTSINFAM